MRGLWRNIRQAQLLFLSGGKEITDDGRKYQRWMDIAFWIYMFFATLNFILVGIKTFGG